MTNVNLDIVKGNCYTNQFTALDSSSGIINLSGYAFAGDARFRYDTSGSVFTFSPYSTTLGAPSGLVSVNILSETTTGCPVGSYYYHIDAYNNTNRITLFYGFINISPNVFFYGAGTTTSDAGAGTVPNAVRQISYGHGVPTASPSDTSDAAIYYDLDTYQTYFWNPATQSW